MIGAWVIAAISRFVLLEGASATSLPLRHIYFMATVCRPSSNGFDSSLV